MQSPIRDQYLYNELSTASPQRLQFMLIDAAIRFTRRAEDFWQAGDMEQAGESLIRAQEIVSELLGGLRPDVAPELVAKVSSVYNFIYRTLVQAHMEHDLKLLGDALRVLEIERDTWRQVCEKLADAPPEQPVVAPTVAAPPLGAPVSTPHSSLTTTFDAAGGISFEA